MSEHNIQTDRSGVSSIVRLQHELERAPFNKWLGAQAQDVDEDRRIMTICVPYRPEFSYHPQLPVFHGGVLAAIIDIAGYAAVAIWNSGATPTASLQVEYLAPAAGGEIIASGILRRLGRTLSRADVELSVNGHLVALGRGTFATMSEDRR